LIFVTGLIDGTRTAGFNATVVAAALTVAKVVEVVVVGAVVSAFVVDVAPASTSFGFPVIAVAATRLKVAAMNAPMITLLLNRTPMVRSFRISACANSTGVFVGCKTRTVL
jgi:hypothetical protein